VLGDPVGALACHERVGSYRDELAAWLHPDHAGNVRSSPQDDRVEEVVRSASERRPCTEVRDLRVEVEALVLVAGHTITQGA
jgi:hypothetical protein